MEIVISLLLSIICYLIFPICYRYSIGKVSEKKGKKLALWNSIICEAIFTIGGFAIGVEPSTNGTMFAQGFFYYFIAKKILVDYSIDEEQQQEKEEKIENVSTCKNCGMLIFSDEEKCSNCQTVNPHYNEKRNNISSTQPANKKTNVFDNIILSKDEQNKEVISNKYLSEEEKQKLFKIKDNLINRDTERLATLIESYKDIAYIEPTKKKKLEKKFLRTFDNVFKIKDLVIDGKKSKLYYFNPESIFSNIGAFWCLLEIGVRNPRYFALEFSFDCSFVVTEWSFTEDGHHQHSLYTTLVDGVQDFLNHGTKMTLTDEFIEEVKRIIHNKGGQDNE